MVPKINECFDIARPLIEFSFAMILQRANNIFELMTVEPIEALLRVGISFYINDRYLVYFVCRVRYWQHWLDQGLTSQLTELNG